MPAILRSSQRSLGLPTLLWDNDYCTSMSLLGQHTSGLQVCSNQRLDEPMDHERILIDTSLLIDLFIAATAVAHDLPLLTLNVRHFEQVKTLTVLTPASL